MNAESLLHQVRELVDLQLQHLLPSPNEEPTRLHEAMRYSCLAPGKRIRPALCLAAADAVEGTNREALDAACAIEMVHVFSLVHDDLPAIDDDDLRRGLATCHKEFGEAIAILAGDALFSRGFEILAQLNLPPKAALECIREIARSTGTFGLVGGEVTDVLSEGHPVSAETLAMIHERKTGALIACSCAIGGLVAGKSDEHVDRLRRFGMKLGLAFQITDDVLNVTSSAEQLGKAVGSDESRAKATYPGVFGLDASKRKAEETLDLAKRELDGVVPPSHNLLLLANYAVQRLS